MTAGGAPSLDIAAVAATLLAKRQPAGGDPVPALPGVYAIFLRDDAVLPIEIGHPSRVIYVGMTEDSLELRDHFVAPASGFSTLRRSLGALLKSDLGLAARPRGPGASRTNITNYRFDADGERRLSEWMGRSLDWAVYPMVEGIRSSETALIGHLCPPLNLTKWRNPQRARVMDLRKACATEAAGERRND